MKLPRVLLAAGKSGSGKTLLTCGLLMALQKRGLSVCSFKCGPDYIDPMFHAKVLGMSSGNLDTYFTSPSRTNLLLGEALPHSDIAVLEGVMGYYDGVGGSTVQASAYDLARVTDTPVILIVDAAGMSLSLAAMIQGFISYREDSRIAGVILNRMSPSFYPRIKKAVEKVGVPVLGYVPVLPNLHIESRHLGLYLPDEVPSLLSELSELASILEETVKVDEILRIAGEARPLKGDFSREEWAMEDEAFGYKSRRPLRIGLARDEAFCFFYQENLRLLRNMGAELIPFSPMREEHLPEKLDGLLLYGGYPELHAKTLSENISMRREIKEAIEGGLPCMAECGGFLYLHEEMDAQKGGSYPMAGVIEGKAYRTGHLKRFGYVSLQAKGPVFGNEDLGFIPAHEFHYYDSTNNGCDFIATKPLSGTQWECLHAKGNLLAGFPHFYYYAVPGLAKAFLSRCEEFR